MRKKTTLYLQIRKTKFITESYDMNRTNRWSDKICVLSLYGFSSRDPVTYIDFIVSTFVMQTTLNSS